MKLRLPSIKELSFEEQESIRLKKQMEWDEKYLLSNSVAYDKDYLYARIRYLEEENIRLKDEIETQHRNIECFMYRISFCEDQLDSLNKYLAAAKKYNELDKDFNE